MRKLLSFSFVALLSIFLAGCYHNKGTDQQQSQTSTTSQSSQFSFQNPKKSAHYETNTPNHGAILAGVPINIVIDFNFDLAENSRMEIHYFGSVERIGPNDWGVGKTTIDANKLTMRRNFDPTAPDGRYSVVYNACWPDGSCHDGSFEFAIDKAQATNYTDMTGQPTITVDMKNIAFVPQNIKISKGTEITWTNNDTVSHYVNTDSHPAHTYQSSQNSKEIKPQETFSFTFTESGIYPYHCSAHTQMTANILVE